jgi:D-glycerate 3-kinase
VGAQYIPDLPASCSPFTKDCNDKLRDYQPLWQFLDYLVALLPTDYRYSLQWRQLAERKQIEQGRQGMTPAEVQAFVEYFWEALPPAIYLPAIAKRANLVVYLNGDRQIVSMTTGSSDS